ncbi:fez family zinc finger protein 2-like isoform X2 [Penaeus japonicus]|uniref:fez family zinc finger protein 2-like isoform X2 n=1 Tax=Penaeus japonicus TaxID=27405 RepID=UPI001C70FF63|nr:fez family zinc finger protein 2-like isoform X2 [Penaeus japonicus]
MVVLKTDFSHCPLKKRPLSVCYDATGEQTEPHDLSLKCTRESPSDHHEEQPTDTHEAAVRDAQREERRAQALRTHALHIPSRYTPSTSTPAGLADSRISSYSGSASRVPFDQEMCVDVQTPDSRACPLPASVTRLSASPAEQDHVEARLNSRSPSTRGARHQSGDIDSPVLGTSGIPVAGTGPLLGASTPPFLRLHQDVTTPRGVQAMPRSAMEAPCVLQESTRGDLEQRQYSAPSFSAPPHRPWLAEGPFRSVNRQYPEINVPLPPARPRPLMAGSPGLWAGVVPLSWAVPPLLPPPRPPSPGRPRLECRSPGSESASSDGSSGGGRGETRYSCTECTKSYSTYSGLSKHKQFHCAALGAKSFGCKHCDKVYTSLGALKMHIRTHTLPCKCHLCGKAFSRPWLLQGHIRTHTGEKPFQCSQCDRCFADRSNLRAHLQTHAHVKKYACSTCHKTFSRMSLLNKHTEAACPAIHRRVVP